MRAGEYAKDWWNSYSTLEQRQVLCRYLRWPESYAEGEASLEWLTSDQIEKLRGVSTKKLAEIEKETE